MGRRKKRTNATQGTAGFDAHFARVYDRRWPRLRRALHAPGHHVAALNTFLPDIERHTSLAQARRNLELHDCFESSQPFASPDTITDTALYPYYLLDPASVMAARVLHVSPGHDVLDMCAAPGGKSFILARTLHTAGTLTSNELDRERRANLMRVFDRYLPRPFHERLFIEDQDASTFSPQTPHKRYDRILCDVPCSSERHLLQHSGNVLRNWSADRTRRMARLQYGIVSRAVDLLRPGGRLVYSTCSISPVENDGVIRKLLERRAGKIERISPGLTWGEPTTFGWQLMPDVTDWGPMYIAVLEHVS